MLIQLIELYPVGPDGLRVLLQRTASYTLREALGAPLYRPFELLSQFWSVWMDSNHRPRAYQARALAT